MRFLISFFKSFQALSVEFALKHGLFKDYFGMTHMGSLFKIIGLSGFAVLAEELMGHIELIVSQVEEFTFFINLIDNAVD